MYCLKGTIFFYLLKNILKLLLKKAFTLNSIVIYWYLLIWYNYVKLLYTLHQLHKHSSQPSSFTFRSNKYFKPENLLNQICRSNVLFNWFNIKYKIFDWKYANFIEKIKKVVRYAFIKMKQLIILKKKITEFEI